CCVIILGVRDLKDGSNYIQQPDISSYIHLHQSIALNFNIIFCGTPLVVLQVACLWERQYKSVGKRSTGAFSFHLFNVSGSTLDVVMYTIRSSHDSTVRLIFFKPISNDFYASYRSLCGRTQFRYQMMQFSKGVKPFIVVHQ
uniref:Uncharacterized protein n=1 Tax=Glossina palpalis gambiensis TaxID=67801 RepID=A0A1B0BF19_9MUSC